MPATGEAAPAYEGGCRLGGRPPPTGVAAARRLRLACIQSHALSFPRNSEQLITCIIYSLKFRATNHTYYLFLDLSRAANQNPRNQLILPSVREILYSACPSLRGAGTQHTVKSSSVDREQEPIFTCGEARRSMDHNSPPPRCIFEIEETIGQEDMETCCIAQNLGQT